jgi:hypothetical protein
MTVGCGQQVRSLLPTGSTTANKAQEFMSSNAADAGRGSLVEPGQVWLRKRSSAALVRRVRAVENGKVHYEVLHGPASFRRNRLGSCTIRSFVKDAWQIEEQSDYSHLDGTKQFATVLVLTTQGDPLLRCSQKRADFYLKKGYARQVSEGVLQFTDSTTEKTLVELYLGEFSTFFLAVKNDACVCCGRSNRLSRHHVFPKRHLRRVPLPWRNCLSNVLFVCLECHEQYEQTPKPDPQVADWREYVFAWKDHFIRVMNPRFLPTGWDIVSVSNLDAVGRGHLHPRGGIHA